MNNNLSEYLETATGYNQTIVNSVITSFFKFVNISLRKGEEVKLENIGKFSARDLPTRQGRNPRTGEPLIIPAKRKAVVKFSDKFLQEIQPEKQTNILPILPSIVTPPPLPINTIISTKKWFINLNNQTSEVLESELKGMGITVETLVWNQDLDGWKLAKDVPELNYLFV